MKTIRAKTSSRRYDIKVGKHLYNQIPHLVDKYFDKYSKAVIVTNKKIMGIYSDIIRVHIKQPLDAEVIEFNDGERYKTLASVQKIYSKLYELKFSRDDLLFALGGGVIGDMAGFASATYNRGIKLIHIPTTIIGQVDSSIGGKVVVNYKSKKNLIGCFYQPHMVVSDMSFLQTLDRIQILNGFGEIIKYGLLFDRSILDDICKYFSKSHQIYEFIQSDVFEEISYKCAMIKTKVVQKDEYDLDYRNLLNFGHTIGHALEAESNLKSPRHGIFVGLGMLCAVDISIELGLLDKEVKKILLDVYKKIGLPLHIHDIDIKKILEAMSFDKKISKGKNKFILLEGINKPIFYYDIDAKIIKDSIIKNVRAKNE
jgi:3-dehydroquinate synthase